MPAISERGPARLPGLARAARRHSQGPFDIPKGAARPFEAWPAVCLRRPMARAFPPSVSASGPAAFKASATPRRMSSSGPGRLMRPSGVPSKPGQARSPPSGTVGLAGMEGSPPSAGPAQLHTVAALGTPSALATPFPPVPPRTSLAASALVSGSQWPKGRPAVPACAASLSRIQACMACPEGCPSLRIARVTFPPHSSGTSSALFLCPGAKLIADS